MGGAPGRKRDGSNALPVPRFRRPESVEPNTAAESNQSETALSVSSNVPALSWTAGRDPVHQEGSSEWRGGSSAKYSWGREDTHELMQYRADDLHPEKSSVHGEVEMDVKLKHRTLVWRGILDARSDRDFFYVRYKRENGVLLRSKT